MPWLLIFLISIILMKAIFMGVLFATYIKLRELEERLPPPRRHPSGQYEYNCTREDLSEYCP